MNWTEFSILSYSYDKKYPNAPDSILKPDDLKTWALDENPVKDLKEFIRFHHSVVQNDICAYCRLPIRFNGYGEAIEHIVPKSYKPAWMFHPKNVCLACYGCNTKKHTKDTLVTRHDTFGNRYEDYPTSGVDFNIYHPHYEKYSDHLQINGFICKAKPNSKGVETINACKLNRPDVLNNRVRQKNLGSEEVYVLALRIVCTENPDSEAAKSAKEMVIQLIKRYKYWNDLNS